MFKETKIVSEDSMEELAEAIKVGKLVVFPTETVYGIGADALNPKAVEDIFKAKGRPADNPLIVHIADLKQAFELVEDFNENAKKLAKAFWPGPITLILKKSNIVPKIVTAGLDSIAIRMPDHDFALGLIKKSGKAIAAPSANLSGSPSPTTAQHCIDDLNGRVDYIVKGRNSKLGVESTVVLLTGNTPVILRPGGVTPEQIKDVVGEVEISPSVINKIEDLQPVLSPGMKYKHYSPKSKVVLVKGSSQQFINFCNNLTTQNAMAIAFDEEADKINITNISYGKKSSPEEQAHNVFAAIRKADSFNKSILYIHAPVLEGVGLAVYNRLIRAAEFEQINL